MIASIETLMVNLLGHSIKLYLKSPKRSNQTCVWILLGIANKVFAASVTSKLGFSRTTLYTLPNLPKQQFPRIAFKPEQPRVSSDPASADPSLLIVLVLPINCTHLLPVCTEIIKSLGQGSCLCSVFLQHLPSTNWLQTDYSSLKRKK